MGSIGGMLGLGGGASGTGFAGPSTGNVVSAQQLNDASTQANNALAQQAAFAKAVAPGSQQGLAAQQTLLGQLQQGAAGQGPNPALAQLHQTTAQNIANQAAMQASQRGVSQNAGLIARQAAQQGAATQQQAAGQAATQQAQQQIAYQQALGQQAGSMVGQQAAANQAFAGSALGQQQALTNAAAGLQQSVNQANAALAGTAMQGQQGLMSNLMPSAGQASSLWLVLLVFLPWPKVEKSKLLQESWLPMDIIQDNMIKISKDFLMHNGVAKPHFRQQGKSRQFLNPKSRHNKLLPIKPPLLIQSLLLVNLLKIKPSQVHLNKINPKKTNLTILGISTME